MPTFDRASLGVADSNGQLEEAPLCLRCLAPVHPLQHYCHQCGDTVGQLTPYIPYVNIRFYVSIYERLWRRLWFEHRDSIWIKIFFIVFIAWTAPILILGMPFVLWRRWRADRHRLKRGVCVTCGYNMRGSQDACPECGTVAVKSQTGQVI